MIWKVGEIQWVLFSFFLCEALFFLIKNEQKQMKMHLKKSKIKQWIK